MLTFMYVPDNGPRIILGPPPFVLTGVDGIHGLSATIHSFTQYLQDGETYVSSQLESRYITFRFTIVGDVIPNRIAMLKALAPKMLGTLILKRGDFIRQIRCVVEQGPTFPSTNGYKGTIVLKAPNPYWGYEEETKVEIASWGGGYKWPAIHPITGFTFGNRTPSSVIDAYNDGDAEIGMRVAFVALGTVNAPSLISVRTYRHITVNMPMQPGERIEVSTVAGNKYAYHYTADGVVTNVFHKLDADSDLSMRLAKGDNLFRYNASVGADVLDVFIYYRQQLLGV